VQESGQGHEEDFIEREKRKLRGSCLTTIRTV